MDDPEENFFSPETERRKGEEMWKCYMGNQGFGNRRVYLEKTRKKRNKLKTGGCVDKTLRPWSLLKCNKYFSRETMHKANKLIN